MPAGDRIQVGVRAHLIAAAGILETTLALAALAAQTSCPASRRSTRLDPTAPACRCRERATRRAATSRSSCVAASPEPTPRCSSARLRLTAAAPAPGGCARAEPIRCGIDSVEIARIERLLAETPADDLAQALLGERARATAATAPAARRALPPVSPRRRPASSCFRAKPRWARSRPPTSRSRATITARRASCAMPRARKRARPRIASPTIAVSLTHDRRSASAVALAQRDVDRGAARGHAAVPDCCRSGARVVLDNLRRVFGERRSRGRDRAPRAGALRAPGQLARRVPPLSLPVGEYASARWCASRTSSF